MSEKVETKSENRECTTTTTTTSSEIVSQSQSSTGAEESDQVEKAISTKVQVVVDDLVDLSDSGSSENSGRITKIDNKDQNQQQQDIVEQSEVKADEDYEQDFEQEEISVRSSEQQLEEACDELQEPAEDYEEDQDDEEDDNTMSSEAIVDDIELILYPNEEVQDLPDDQLRSPTLVRVTELLCQSNSTLSNSGVGTSQSSTSNSRDYRSHSFQQGSSSGDSRQRKSKTGRSLKIRRRSDGGEDYPSDEEDYEDEGVDDFCKFGPEDFPNISCNESGLATSGVQTEITALESHNLRFTSGLRVSSSSRGGQGQGTKRLNWKSELTLLPSKAKLEEFGITHMSSSGSNYNNYTNFNFPGGGGCRSTHGGGGLSDQYSPRQLSKYTSLQDNALSSQSQFLRPSTLYRTRNLSRNLNRFASSSETTLVLANSTEISEYPSPRGLGTSQTSGFGGSSTSTSQYQPQGQFKGQTSYQSISSSAKVRNSGISEMVNQNLNQTKSFRLNSSLPDLTAAIGGDGKSGNYPLQSHSQSGRNVTKSRHNYNYTKNPLSGKSGNLQLLPPKGKKLSNSSDDDETSSLIDESEKCLRTSIDMLLTDDFAFGESPYRSSTNFAYQPGGGGRSTTTSGYYSSRRYASQPVLIAAGDIGYGYSDSGPMDQSMGSPFLPRKLCDMRCSRWAKVILPQGQVQVVAVKEIDEFRDILTVHTDTGCILNLPFRKVVFAWRTKR